MLISLKRRLVGILLGLTVAAWLASALLTYIYAGAVMRQQVDRQLEQYSDLVSYITRIFARQLDAGQPLSEPWLQDRINKIQLAPMVIDAPLHRTIMPALNIWEKDQLIAVLAGSPQFARPVDEGIALLRMGDGSDWRVLTRFDPVSGLWIRVGIEYGAARWDALGVLSRALLPLLVVLPLTLWLLYFGVGRGLRPLQQLAQQISQRKPALLDPVDITNVPLELKSVVDSLNDLFARLATALESEQRFTANAAHELLTPLAAIKAEVQLCQRQAQDEAGRGMLARIAQRVDRAGHTVQQLLTLARVDPQLPQLFTPIALRSLLVEVLAENAHLAAERDLRIDLAEGDDYVVEGNHEALAILLRNLLVNAFRYAVTGSTVRIGLSGPDPVQLEVHNDCARLSTEAFARISERFYRVPGSDQMGSGLGLSIVSRIAQLHGARFWAGPSHGGEGFCATLSINPQSLYKGSASA